MALQAIVESLDDVPEGLREYYEKGESGYRLTVDGVDDAAELKDALKKERDARKRAERTARKVKDLDLDEIEAMRERLAQFEEDQATSKGDWEKARAQLTERYTKDIEKERARSQTLEGRLEKVLKRDAALQAVTAYDGIPDALLHHVESFIDLNEEDGDLKVVARGIDGEEVEGIDALVKQMKESGKYDWGFKPNGATGGGATGRRAGGATNVSSRSKLSTAERAAFIREHGSEAYLALPE